MNIVFVCTAEFEPFFYKCLVDNIKEEKINTFYAGFLIDTRRAIAKIKQQPYPLKLNFKDFFKYRLKDSLFSHRQLQDIVDYDFSRLSRDGFKINREKIIKKAIYYEKFFDSFYHYFDIKSVVVWNYFPTMVAVARLVAERKGIKVIYLENGPFRNTLMIDKEGVNFQSSLSGKNKDFYLNQKKPDRESKDSKCYEPAYDCQNIAVNKGIMSPLKKMLYAILMRNFIYRRFFPELTDDRLLDSLVKKIYRFFLLPDKVKLPDKFIFLPLQYSYDTQVLVNSPWLKDMPSFIEVCYKAVKETAGDYSIVVKEHPDDFGRKDYSWLKKKYPEIIWLKKYDIKKVLKNSSAVITINSSVGIEALVEYKPVIVLGNSFYNVEGVVNQAASLGSLKEAVKAALRSELDRELIDKFLYHLRFDYLVEGNPRRCDRYSLSAASVRLEKLLKTGERR
jgi:capsule polysaccharide modification protein KpsS